jgi:hypothetical protein
MASQFLGLWNRNRPFEFSLHLRLLLPKAVLLSCTSPANQVSCYDVRNAAGHALPFLHLESPGADFG